MKLFYTIWYNGDSDVDYVLFCVGDGGMLASAQAGKS
jgi:hypothetical protein